MIELAEAYWISPEGNIHEVPNKHINFISQHKEMFGLSEQDYYSRFDKYKEPYGFEGRAREELMRKQFSNGWIRCRYRPVHYYWIIELYELSENARLYLSRWAKYISEQGELDNTNVLINNVKYYDSDIHKEKIATETNLQELKEYTFHQNNKEDL
jgi:hypothetical protein